MTVENTTNRTTASGDGVTTDFNFSFKILTGGEQTDLLVYLVNKSTGATTLQTYTTDYTIILNTGSEGGTVYFVEAPAAIYNVLMYRFLTYTQGVNIPLNRRFPEDNMEYALDRAVMIDQQVNEIFDRTPKLSLVSSFTNITLPDPTAGTLLGWNTSGTDMQNYSITDLGITTAGDFGNQLIQSDTQTTALGLLGFQTADDVISAGTIDLDAADGDIVDVTGTTTITAITLAEGSKKTVRFTGALTLTNGASLVLPGESDIITAAGDYAVFVGYAGGVVRCSNYSRINIYSTFSNKGQNFLRKQITISNGTDTDHDIDFTAGNFIFSDGTGQAYSSSTITKQFDSAWAEGTSQGGLDTGSLANNTWYYLYAIYNPTTGNVDFIGSTDPSSPTLPTGYTKYRRLKNAFFKTNGSANIIQFYMNENCWQLATTVASEQILVSALNAVAGATLSDAFPSVAIESSLVMGLSTTQAGYSSFSIWGNLQPTPATGAPATESLNSSTIGTNNGFSTMGTGVIYADDGALSYRNFDSSGGVDKAKVSLISIKEIGNDF